MRRWAWLLLLAGCAPDEASPASREAGRRAWNSCSACHAVPDRAVESDRVWIEMLQTTT